MNKKAVMKSLKKVIARIAIHKILLSKGHKIEAKKHLSDEIRDYSLDAFEKSQMHTWNQEEIHLIKQNAINYIQNFLEKYKDISVTDADINEAVVDTMQELMMVK
ncbi:hypothetical protein HYU06_01880 [Candidatus Woesearchaeota archaeon]|nr:hypothetical protein [Candidatus Woesearchaeota archaeon]